MSYVTMTKREEELTHQQSLHYTAAETITGL